MADKPKIALYWCASCGGCDEAMVDLEERLLDLASQVELVFWPVALDFKRADLERRADGEIFVSFVNGGVRNSEQEEMVELLRRKSRLLIAFGACAQMGGIPGLANLFSAEEIVEAAYLLSPTLDANKTVPLPLWTDETHRLTLPEFATTLRTIDQVVEVDYYVPGCPPSLKLITGALDALLKDELPAKGAVLAPDFALCDECPRKDSKPERLEITAFHRPYEIEIDPENCLLAQGLLCLGASTRAGCDAACILGNMPCTGCYGPTSRVLDQGSKAASGIASLIAANEPEQIDQVISGIPDPVGTFYRYSLPGSLLQHKDKAKSGGGVR